MRPQTPIFAALSVAGAVGIQLGYLVAVLTVSSQHKDCLGGPFLGVLGVLALVLAVGIAERWLIPDRDYYQD